MPRPKKYHGGTAIITALAPDDLVEQIDEYARSVELTRSDIVIQLLRDKFPRRPYGQIQHGDDSDMAITSVSMEQPKPKSKPKAKRNGKNK